MISGWIDGWMDGWMDGRTDGWMNRWVDGWMDGWRDGGKEGKKDEGREGGSNSVHGCLIYGIFKYFVSICGVHDKCIRNVLDGNFFIKSRLCR
jgi:hypothetical protein